MQDAPLGRVVQARDQVGEGGLARAAGPDQRHQLAGLDAEGDVLQRRFARLAAARRLPRLVVWRSAALPSLWLRSPDSTAVTLSICP